MKDGVYNCVTKSPYISGLDSIRLMQHELNHTQQNKMQGIHDSYSRFNSIKVKKTAPIEIYNRIKPHVQQIFNIYNEYEQDFIESGDTEGFLMAVITHFSGIIKNEDEGDQE